MVKIEIVHGFPDKMIFDFVENTSVRKYGKVTDVCFKSINFQYYHNLKLY